MHSYTLKGKVKDSRSRTTETGTFYLLADNAREALTGGRDLLDPHREKTVTLQAASTADADEHTFRPGR